MFNKSIYINIIRLLTFNNGKKLNKTNNNSNNNIGNDSNNNNNNNNNNNIVTFANINMFLTINMKQYFEIILKMTSIYAIIICNVATQFLFYSFIYIYMHMYSIIHEEW